MVWHLLLFAVVFWFGYCNYSICHFDSCHFLSYTAAVLYTCSTRSRIHRISLPSAGYLPTDMQVAAASRRESTTLSMGHVPSCPIQNRTAVTASLTRRIYTCMTCSTTYLVLFTGVPRHKYRRLYFLHVERSSTVLLKYMRVCSSMKYALHSDACIDNSSPLDTREHWYT